MTISTSEPKTFARLMAVQALYNYDITDAEQLIWDEDGAISASVVGFYKEHAAGEVDDDMLEQDIIKADKRYFKQLVKGAIAQTEQTDTLILTQCDKATSLEQMDRVVLAMLRCGAYELLAETDTPTTVIISEYVKISEIFFGQEQTGFINAVLDGIAGQTR